LSFRPVREDCIAARTDLMGTAKEGGTK
jgi:hypothetical protein